MTPPDGGEIYPEAFKGRIAMRPGGKGDDAWSSGLWDEPALPSVLVGARKIDHNRQCAGPIRDGAGLGLARGDVCVVDASTGRQIEVAEFLA